jgi:energy-coupling factor transport system permease protein
VILSSSFTFVVTTDPDALANAMIRWGIPYRHGYTLILALRFVPFFRNELRIVRDAQRMRGLKASVRSVRSIRRAIRYTFVPVLVSGLIRVDTIAVSMKGRAFGLHRRRTLPPRTRWVWEDGLVWACSVGCIGLALYAGGRGWL